MAVAEEQKLIAGTKYPEFTTFHVAMGRKILTNESTEEDVSTSDSSEDDVAKDDSSEKVISTTESTEEDLILNIIDTPGLFERGTEKIEPRDNSIIMQAIDACVNQEITKFHVICFCVAITVGINQEDIQALKLLLETIGDKVASNSCLIITHCESKDKKQRKTLKSQLFEDTGFKSIAPFFKKGIFFSGVLNRDDYKRGSESLIDQYITVCNYRAKLIKTFREAVEPFPLIHTLISDSRRARDNHTSVASKLEWTETALRHAKEDLHDTQNHLEEAEKELTNVQSKLDNTDAELGSTQNELKKKQTDLEEMQSTLKQLKLTETELRSIIADFGEKCAMDQRHKQMLQEKLESETERRQEAETIRQREIEARRLIEAQHEAEVRARREERADEYEKYRKQVEARDEETKKRKEAERQREMAVLKLRKKNNEPCSPS
jgi:flagellin-like hook-associated protein FlgL